MRAVLLALLGLVHADVEQDLADALLQMDALREENALLRSQLERRLQDCCECPAISPYWNVSSGTCGLEDDCITSPNYCRGEYPNDDSCVINISENWTGYLKITSFETEEFYDYLEINGIEYSDEGNDLNGVVPSGSIVWSSDHVTSDPGWMICRVDGVFTSTTVVIPEHISIYFSVEDGECLIDDAGCVTTPDFGSDYPNNDKCAIQTHNFTGYLDVIDFETENKFDLLTVNDNLFSGELNDDEGKGLHGIVPTGVIMWTSDYIFAKSGWKLCHKEFEFTTTWIEPWTCTISGARCPELPFTSKGVTFDACTMQFSDVLDVNQNDNQHDGLPFCIGADGIEELSCGPCSCGVGQEQSYRTYSAVTYTAGGQTESQRYIECSPCPEGRFKDLDSVGQTDECKPCGTGQYTNWSGATACVDCEVGSFSLDSASACTPCPAGNRSSSPTSCDGCPPGFFTSVEGQTECDECPVGTYQAEEGSSTCMMCAAGRYVNKPNSSACIKCSVGSFQSMSGSSRCDICYEILDPGGPNEPLWTTMSQVSVGGVLEWAIEEGTEDVSHCGCNAGGWLDLSGHCHYCGEGLICLGKGTVLLEENFFSPYDNAGSVWSCSSVTKRCPGGRPGTCASHRRNTSIACGVCEVGYRDTSDGPCSECGATETWILVLFGFGMVLCVFIIYYSTATENRAKQKDSVVLIAIMGSQLVTAMQMMGVFDLLIVQWPEPFATILRWSGVLNLDLNVLSVNCLVTTSSLVTYLSTCLGVGVLLFSITCVHALYVSLFHDWQFREQMPCLIGSVGTVFMAVFISISTAIFAPFQCDSHPNGYQTVSNFDQVVCWTTDFGTEHRDMVIVGGVASLIPISFIALTMWVIFTLPVRVRSGDTNFLHAFAFLIFRFRPGSPWYILVLLGRNLLAALVTVIGNEALQLFSLCIVMLPGVILSSAVFPWRVYLANLLDISINAGFLVTIFLAALLSEHADEMLVANLITLVLVFMAVVLVCCIGYTVQLFIAYRGKTFKFFLCHHKQGASGFARLLKMRLKHDSRCKRQVFLDSDNLSDLSLLFGDVGNRTDTLVVLCTKEILSRPWCVGEMTTARLHAVDTVIVMFPDFTWPSKLFVENYAEHVEGIRTLSSYGISVAMTQDTLKWLPNRPQIILSKEFTLSSVDAVVGKLLVRQRGRAEMAKSHGVISLKMARTSTRTKNLGNEEEGAEEGLQRVATQKSELSSNSQPTREHHRFSKSMKLSDLFFSKNHIEHRVLHLPESAPLSMCTVAIVADLSNRESVCTALMIRELVLPHLSHLPEKVPHVISEDHLLPNACDTLLVCCSNGCFQQAHFLQQLFVAYDLHANLLPLIVEENFRFPSETFYEEVRRCAPIALEQENQVDALMEIIALIFKEIAISVSGQDSEEVLHVRAHAITTRITSSRSRMSNKDRKKPKRHQKPLEPKASVSSGVVNSMEICKFDRSRQCPAQTPKESPRFEDSPRTVETEKSVIEKNLSVNSVSDESHTPRCDEHTLVASASFGEGDATMRVADIDTPSDVDVPENIAAETVAERGSTVSSPTTSLAEVPFASFHDGLPLEIGQYDRLANLCCSPCCPGPSANCDFEFTSPEPVAVESADVSHFHDQMLNSGDGTQIRL